MPPLSHMIVAAHQLHYLPWLRYMHKIAAADVFVVLDNIQFNKNGWQNRNKIKTPQGAFCLTVPVYHHLGQLLNEVVIDNKQPWKRKHWGNLETHYRKAPYFKEHELFFKQVYETEWERMNDLNYQIFLYLVKALGIQTKILRGSELPLRGGSTERLAVLCKDLGAKAYLTGAFAAQEYLDESLFGKEGIEVLYQRFECPEYSQMYPEAGFIPELSVVDLLFNCGARALEILMQGKPFTSKAGEAA